MILRLTTSHENSSVETKPFVFNKTFRYFHGREESRLDSSHYTQTPERDSSLRSE